MLHGVVWWHCSGVVGLRNAAAACVVVQVISRFALCDPATCRCSWDVTMTDLALTLHVPPGVWTFLRRW